MSATSTFGNTSSLGAHKALRAVSALWFSTTAFGQGAFALYVASFYGGAAIARRFDRWNEVLVGGYVRGGTLGNVVLATHLLLAFVVIVGGPLQLVPALRARWPAFHRWNGRVYLATAAAAAASGLYAVWTRGTAGGVAMRVGISVNALVILVCSSLVLGAARARAISGHRRWALRAFLAVSGVWFFRVGLMFWVLLNRGPVGIGDDFDGPFVRAWAFGCYALPLLALESFLWAEARAAATGKIVAAALLLALTLMCGVGIAGAVVGMWLPKM